ncbi:CLUMA_CG007490, isoform A [Clunio marinus]|uniref:CLUMA_CG007490, isoform A n=1 Tax=Clunio marinus TaxID=568069 RepID=A0A1J1I2Z8_9DIPT|nr:CLUMA_CG007490, isoform A [Clunio marinus]
MAVYYVASKLSFVACRTRCISERRRRKYFNDDDNLESTQKNETNWKEDELIKTCLTNPNIFIRSLGHVSEANSKNEADETERVNKITQNDSASSVTFNGIVTDINGMVLSGPLEILMTLLIPQDSTDIDQNFVFSFLLSSRIFLQPHELLGKLIKSVPENDESLERLVVMMDEWTRWFPYDFRGEEIMTLIKHIAARCGSNTLLGDRMSDILSALLIKLTDLSQHEEEMKSFKRPLSEEVVVWPTSSKLAQLLCHFEKRFAKHIGPEEFVQCSSNLIKQQSLQQSNYDVPSSTSASSSSQVQLPDLKKKTCNLENYFDWSNRLRVLVANEILQCTNETDRTKRIELWSSVAQHCLLVGNYNSATSILEPICRLQTMIITPNSSPPPTQRNHSESSITKVHQKPKSEWVVLPVFVDIVKLALKAREDCSTRMPNGSINFCAFNELAAIVSAFTIHMSNVPVSPAGCSGEYSYLVNHILTCTLRDENELFAAFEKEASKIESYYDVP